MTANVPATIGPLDRPAPSELGLWVADARGAFAVAEQLASTTFVPSALRGKPIDVMALMMAGQELGLRPMAAFRSIDIIQGTPALRAHAMRGMVQARGYDIEVVEADDTHCVMRGRRGRSAEWQTVTWDLDRARRMDLLGRDQWKKQPRTMLIARATGELCRLIAADVLYAMPYATEELTDEPVRGTAAVERPRAATIADIVQPERRAVTGVETPEESAAIVAQNLEAMGLTLGGMREPVDIGDAPLAISPEQSKVLHDHARAQGRNTKAKLVPLLLEVTGREVADTSQLTADEADRVIARLETDYPQAPEQQPELEP